MQRYGQIFPYLRYQCHVGVGQYRSYSFGVMRRYSFVLIIIIIYLFIYLFVYFFLFIYFLFFFLLLHVRITEEEEQILHSNLRSKVRVIYKK